MSEKSLMKQWYTPVEITTLKKWIFASCIVNMLLLTFDFLRDEYDLLLAGILACILLGLLYHNMPSVHEETKRNFALGLSSIIFGIGIFKLISLEITIFNIWLNSWIILPSAISLLWLSSRPVTVWTSKELSISAVEYGLERNHKLIKKYRNITTHLTLLHFVMITVLPLIWIIDTSLSPGNALGGELGDSFTTQHFEKVLSGESFQTWLSNSLIVSIGTCLLGLTIAIPAGYAFSRFKFSGRNVSMFAFLLVQMFPGIIILVPYFLVMKSLGLLNSHIGLILAYCVTALPLCVWMLKGFFDTIPRELEEAAVLDGCNQFQVFTKVVLPLSVPAVAVTGLFSFLAAWNEFLLALTFNTSNDMYTLPVGLASMISSTGQAWGDFAAASILVSIPVALLFLFFQKFLIEGLSVGGVKG